MNLFLMTKVLQNDEIDLKKESGTISLTLQRHQKLLFDRIIHVGQGTLLGIDIVPMYENVNTAVITYKQLHGRLGNPNDAVLRAILVETVHAPSFASKTFPKMRLIVLLMPKATVLCLIFLLLKHTAKEEISFGFLSWMNSPSTVGVSSSKTRVI
jgi:hypothetical protein